MLHHNRMPYRRLGALMLAVVMLIALMTACGNKNNGGMPGSGKGEVIATYKDGGKVTDKEYEYYSAYTLLVNEDKAMYMTFLREQFAKEYAASKAIIASMSEETKKEAEETVKTFEKQLKEAVNTQPDLKEYLKESDLTVNDAVQFFRHDVIFQKYYMSKLDELTPAVTEEELKQEYEVDPEGYNRISARHILISTIDASTREEVRSEEEALKLANEVKAKLDAGGDWTALAKEYSEDPGSKDNGGLYENYQAKGWVPQFKDAANTQAIGAVGEPILTDYGYHVIKVESREEVTFDKLTEEDLEELRTNIAYIKVLEVLEDEQAQYDVQVTLPQPSPSASPSASPSESPSASPSASSSPSASASK